MASTRISFADEPWGDPKFQAASAALVAAFAAAIADREAAEPEFTVEELRLIGRNIERQVRRG